MIPILARSTSLSAGALTLALTSTAAQAAPFVATADQCPKVEELSPAERARARCGLLEVPENPTLPLGRQVKLKVAIVEPPGGKPNDPVVMIHGGPGFGWVELYRSRFAGAFGPRTVIMFDQRGVGLSEPRLCPALSGAVFDASTRGLSAREETARVVAANKACHDSLIAGGFDLTRYNTAATVADMEVLRAALGFEKWNLYGASYGTSVGLAYLAAHPERIRTLILDSVYPLDRQPAANVVVNMLRSLHELALVCTAQPACSARYGDIESLFTRALASLVDNPLELPAMGAAFDQPVKMSATALLTVVHQLLYERTSYPALPLLLDRVAVRDAEVFALLFAQFRARIRGFTIGAFAAVECFERYPFDSRADYEAASARWPLVRDNMTLLAQHYEVCANWPERAATPMSMPGRAGVPVLVMAGAWDPMTPAADSKRTADRLGAFYFELPFHGHGARSGPCGARIARDFLGQPTRMPDTNCGDEVTRPPVIVTSALRAPRLAQFVASVSQRPAALPAIGVGIATLVLLSSLAWPVAAGARMLRHGAPAAKPFRRDSALPLSAAAVTMCLYAGLLVLALDKVNASSSPLVLLVGLPTWFAPIYALPWFAGVCALWGAWRLLDRSSAQLSGIARVHRWLVFAALLGVLVTIAAGALLIPIAI